MSDLALELKTKVGCEYKIATRKNGEITQESGWSKNAITNYGLDSFGSGTNLFQYIQVGSGTSSPAFTDTALEAFVGSERDTTSFTRTVDAAGRWLMLERASVLLAGVATGNIAEVGAGRSAETNLVSRARILDASGDPTVITVLSDEDLVITYRIWIKQPTVDVEGSAGGRDFVVRIAAADRTTAGGGNFRGYWGDYDVYAGTLFGWNGGNYNFAVYDGSLGSMTGEPSGASYAVGSRVDADAYVPGSHKASLTAQISGTVGNFATGISAIAWCQGVCCWQMSIDPPLLKAEPQTARIQVFTTWSRDNGPA